ncbi:MAG: lipase family protein [Candidatus Hodarchaeota archaeon]
MMHPEFSNETALLLCKFAEKAYADKSAFDMSKEGFSTIYAVEDPKTDTQGFIAKHDSRGDVVVAFRGTEKKLKDLATDARFLASGYSYSTGIKGFLARLLALKRVHSGFLKAYRNVRNEVRMQVSDYLSWVAPKRRVFVTGHSLGAALATLCALDLREMLDAAEMDNVPVIMYNFGSPRVGTLRFANYYNRKISDSWRIVNNEDIIATIPPKLSFFRLWLDYRHIAHFMFIDKDGKFDASRTDKEEQNPAKLDSILAIFSDLFDSDSLSDHAISNYYKKLRAISEA